MSFSRFFPSLRGSAGASFVGYSSGRGLASLGCRILRGFLRIALLVAVAGPAGAAPENVDLGDMGLGTAQQICRSANTSAWQSGVALAQPGRWWNPKRYGTGWDLVYNDDRTKLKVFLYTYNASGHPVWLASKMIRIDETTGDFWRADLYEYTKNAATGAIDMNNDVGDVYFRFFRDDPSRIAMRWHWRDIPMPPGSEYFEECLNDLTRLNPTYYTGTSDALETRQLFATSLTPGLNQTFSGYWSDTNNVEAIPGVVMTIMQTSLGDEEGKLGEAAVWLTYNETPEVINGVPKKRPVFMQAQRTQLRPSLPFETDSFDLYFHYAIGYPNGFPTTDCPGPNGCVSNIRIGTYERAFHPGSNYRTAGVRYTLDGADTNGRLTVPNTGGRPPVTLRSQFSPGGVAMATVHRTTRLQDISVNRYVCGLPATVPPGPPPTCDIFVSWSGNTIGKPWKRDLGTLRYDAAPFSVADVGIAPVSMRAGDRFQMELWSGVPDAPGAVMLDKAPEIRGVLLDSANPGAITVPDADLIPNQEDLGTHVATVGAVAGSADVSGGAASYTVPIAVPPGRSGMQPSVSLSYSSRGGNGVAGLGWSLGAGSSIHRCPRTQAQDGVPRGVRLDAEDKLCLDGQRLLSAPGGGTYGTPNARYRTEIESFAQVEQSGSLALGDVCFTVQQKDGRRLTYGCAPVNQQVCAGGVPPRVRPSEKSVELSWLLSRVEDRSGNTMEFCYESGADASEVLLKKIAYTGSTLAGAASPVATPARSVVFDYLARPTDWRGNDRSSSWIAGGGLQQSRRLTEIRTYSPDSALPLRVYELDYRDTAVSDLQYSYTSGRSLLRRIRECAYDRQGTRSCLLPTEFSWSDGNWMFENRRFAVSAPGAQRPAPATPPPDGEEEHYVPEYRRNRIETTGDLDGDGAREWWIVKTWYERGWHTQIQLAKVNADRVTQGVATITGLPPFVRTADLDGDGVAELLGGTTIYKWKRGRGAPLCDGGAATCAVTVDSHFTVVATNLPASSHDSIEGIADFNGDGAPDILMRGPLLNPCTVTSIAPQGADGELPAGCAPLYVHLNTRPGAITGSTTNFAFTRTQMMGTVSSNGGLAESVQHVTDFDGDGLADIVIARASGVTRLLRTTLSGSAPGSIALSPDEAGFSGDTSNLRWLDVNGDGLDDALSVLLPASVTACERVGQCLGFWKLQLNDGGRLRPAAMLDGQTTAGLRFDAVRGGSTPQLRYFGKLLSSDIDADGRGDLLYPARFAARLCFGAYLPHSRFLTQRPAKDCPVQQGHGATCEADVCAAPPPEDGNTWDEHPSAAQPDAADAFKSGLGAFDPSVYRFNAIRFVQTGANAFRLQTDETPVIAATSVLGNQSGRIDDYFGDGLADVVSDVTCPLRPNTLFPLNTCSLAAGGMAGPGLADGSSFVDSSQTIRMSDLVASSNINLLINENQGDGARSGVSPMFPDLMVVAVNGLKERAQWHYYPLSSSAGRSDADFPLYRIDGDYVDARHFLFQSSMPVVSQLARSHAAAGSDGLPAFGTRSVRYAYGGAMYNSEGRGFQGFRTIANETLGQPDRTVRTVTTFHQKFPLTGRIESVETRVPQVAGINGRLSLESFDWRCNLANRLQVCPGQGGAATTPGQIHWPYLSKSTRDAYDLAAAEAGTAPLPVSSTTTLNYGPSGLASGWDAYGNLVYQQVATRDGAGVASGERYYLASHVTTTVSTFDTSAGPVGQWWLNKQTDSRVQTAVSYHARTVPDGVSLSPKEILTQFEWNPDRTPSASTVTDPLSGTILRTGYTYPTPSLGLPVSTIVSGTGIAPVRETRVGYSADGHFPVSTTAVISATTPALNHTATTQVRASDGQPITTTDANGIQIRHEYDAFGHLVHRRSYGSGGVALAPASEVSITPCGTAYPCSASDESTASYYQSVVADGAPSQRAWFDLLGREVKRATRGFDGRWVNVSTRYDTSGTASQTSAPYFTGEAPLYTQLSYDRLGRMKSKRAPVAELNPAQGDVTTTYTYDGLETRIEVRPANASACTASPNLCLSMSRQHNALGQLMRTTDAHGGRTDYWFDPMGGAAALRDANGKTTLASYNSLGHRLESRDPNQGIWSFTYDALGGLLTQTDARGVRTTVVQRDALGRVLEQRREPPGPVGAGSALTDEKVLDRWSYDSAGIKGALAQVQRQTVRSSETFSAQTPVAWQESYGYRLDSGRLHTRTTSSQGGPLVPLTYRYAYDGYYGHLNAVTYPNAPQPLTVWRRYTRYGALSGLVDARMMTPLWSMSQADAYGKPTQEQFGYALTGTTGYSRATGQMLNQAWSPFDRPTFAGSVESIVYGHDVLGNLVSQERKWRRYDVGRLYANVLLDTGMANYLGASKESYRYDGLQRLLGVDRATGTGTVLGLPYGPATSIAYQYDAVGNLVSKSDFADSYTYGTAATPGTVGVGGACGPNALLRTVDTGNNRTRDYRCDSNGNQVGETMTGDQSGTRAVVFDGANLPTRIDHADPWPSANSFGGHVDFAYGPDNTRYRRTERDGTATPIVIHYGADGYEQQISHNQTLHRIDLGPILYTRNVVGTTAAPAQVAYQLRDRLGSTIAMADRWGDFNGTDPGVIFDTGNADGHQRRFYDPFGAPSEPNFTRNTQMPELRWHPYSPMSWRGFTGHEHIDGARLIHMNGRAFDYRSGRFLSVDPIVQAPGNSQSLNPYSYVFNNPLSGTDPSGYAACVSDSSEECGDLGPARQNFSAAAGFAMGGIAILGGDENGNGRLKDPLAPTSKELRQAFMASDIGSLGMRGGSTGNADQFPTYDNPTLLEGPEITPSGKEKFREYRVHYEWWLYPRWQNEFHAWREDQVMAAHRRDGRHLVGMYGKLAGVGALCATTAGGCVAMGAYQTGADLKAGNYKMAAVGGVLTIVGGAAVAAEFRAIRAAAHAAPPSGAANIANGPRLAEQLRLESANSVFTSNGHLTDEVISNAREIIAPGKLGNPAIPSGYGKFTTETYQSPYGNFQVHFYMNKKTNNVYYDLDYKVIFNK